MPNSPFFTRIKKDVLSITNSIPSGKIVTFADIGQHLDVAPRHVAYILTQLKGVEQAKTPWFRVVPETGIVPALRANEFGITQKALLETEGHILAPDGRMLDLAKKLMAVSDLNSGIAKQTRPANAPRPSRILTEQSKLRKRVLKR
jgi:methylated-DNA-protein-cysteine methyltransferase related protein